MGAVALWAASIPGTEEGSPAFQAEKTAADQQVRQSEAARRAAESARGEAEKARDAAGRHAADTLKQKEDLEQRLRDTLVSLSQEQRRREALDKALAAATKPKMVPTRSFVRDWQLIGPFVSTGTQGHDTVYPPEREPFRAEKAYDGFGGRLKWRPYHSPEDKIDLASFFRYWNAGAAYAVSWVHAESARPVMLAVGSDDGVHIWVNGDKVHDVKGGRQARPGQDIVKARLKKGWNEIRTKVDNIVGTWELYLEFRTADGRQPLKILSTNSPPATAG
jgi:hypothetical protein